MIEMTSGVDCERIMAVLKSAMHLPDKIVLETKTCYWIVDGITVAADKALRSDFMLRAVDDAHAYKVVFKNGDDWGYFVVTADDIKDAGQSLDGLSCVIAAYRYHTHTHREEDLNSVICRAYDRFHKTAIIDEMSVECHNPY